jgi:hypothetical protein
MLDKKLPGALGRVYGLDVEIDEGRPLVAGDADEDERFEQ